MSLRRLVSGLVMIAIVGALAAVVPAYAASTAPHTKSTKTAAELLDINSASKEQLMKLPGIGEAYAEKIVSNRPYKAKDELVHKKLIPETTYKKISGKIIAKQKS